MPMHINHNYNINVVRLASYALIGIMYMAAKPSPSRSSRSGKMNLAGYMLYTL